MASRPLLDLGKEAGHGKQLLSKLGEELGHGQRWQRVASLASMQLLDLGEETSRPW